jgi:hypothetical protein
MERMLELEKWVEDKLANWTSIINQTVEMEAVVSRELPIDE